MTKQAGARRFFCPYCDWSLLVWRARRDVRPGGRTRVRGQRSSFIALGRHVWEEHDELIGVHRGYFPEDDLPTLCTLGPLPTAHLVFQEIKDTRRPLWEGPPSWEDHRLQQLEEEND